MRRLLRAGLVAFAALTLAAAAGFAVYEVAEAPGTQIFGHTVVSGPSGQPLVALTFDDGPNPPYTGAILRVLEREHVHATFFVVGRAVAAYPWLVRREVQDGDAVGNHSWNHAHLNVLTTSALRRSLERTSRAIYRAAGVRPKLMRPPFGARDWTVLRVARAMGLRVVMWSVPLARDWEYPSAAVIAARELPYVRDGSILVLHDGNEGQLCATAHLGKRACDRRADIAATRLIILALRARGFHFVTVPQLIAAASARRVGVRRTSCRRVE